MGTPIGNHLSREALEVELWSMLPDDCREILEPIKKSYIESLMADIDSYCNGRRMKWVKATTRLPKESGSFPCKCGVLYVVLEFNIFRGTFQNEVRYTFPMDKVEWLDETAQATPQGIGWVKASERLPKFDGQVHLKVDGINRIGNFYYEEGKNKLYVYGPEPYIVYEDKFGRVEWLDESQPQPVEASFAEWAATLFKYKDGMWEDEDGLYYSTDQLWEKYQANKKA